ncbi:hypothetical protein SAMN05421810_10589 [Amycolatopsis arida]|uniref:Uncharacterized protein n=1 Tax=Amycolatopsis arida TaxID=587909 RepID=A0A1I5WFX1_9PSEU|nr:hypothetical protein CLV69_105108 [Amycolatopsis arida]SFQ18640.1 hypothetical protein SAMN05421810_10589 [Amycolatopsis arida]
MPRMLTSLKFWALTFALAWILTVTYIIAKYPDFAYVPQ